MNSAVRDMNNSNHDIAARQFHELYIALRETENRICSDNELERLPEVDNRHMYHDEWLIRKSSFENLKKFLEQKEKPLNILEVGCGNGWLANGLASIKKTVVTGIDINSTELEQAKRVFAERANLDFKWGDIRYAGFENASFDVIVFAASIQYFPEMKEIIEPALSLLKPMGEIHITDTRFYRSGEAQKARERSAAYFQSLGFDAMSSSYFHHSLESLKDFNFRIMYDPNHLFNQLRKRKAPFHWIMIKK